MNKKLTLSAILFSVTAIADDIKPISLKEIPITANPLELLSEEMVRPIYIMNGINLQNNKKSSLGSTLEKIPGVSNSAWGDNVGRPVIRGMDRNRIQILNNGMQTTDKSQDIPHWSDNHIARPFIGSLQGFRAYQYQCNRSDG